MCVCVCVCVCPLQAPVLDPLSQTVAVVLQYEKKQTTLVTGITCTDPDGDPTRIRLTSVSPGSPCGNCFQVWPCLVGTGKPPDLGHNHNDVGDKGGDDTDDNDCDEEDDDANDGYDDDWK